MNSLSKKVKEFGFQAVDRFYVYVTLTFYSMKILNISDLNLCIQCHNCDLELSL